MLAFFTVLSELWEGKTVRGADFLAHAVLNSRPFLRARLTGSSSGATFPRGKGCHLHGHPRLAVAEAGWVLVRGVTRFTREHDMDLTSSFQLGDRLS